MALILFKLLPSAVITSSLVSQSEETKIADPTGWTKDILLKGFNPLPEAWKRIIVLSIADDRTSDALPK